MNGDPEAEHLAALRAEARKRELFEVQHDGVTTRFYDQGGKLANCHRAGEFYEAEMLGRIAQLGRKGVYVDIGANVGNHTMFFAQHCPSTAVHSFEPLDFVTAILAENVSVNEVADKVVIHQFGLGERTGEVTVQMDKQTYSFGCRRLDDVFRDAALSDPLAVIKIDIEGMEVLCFRGAARTLRRERPLIYVEANTAPELAGVRALLGKFGYRPTGLRFNATATYEFAAIGDPVLRGAPGLPGSKRPSAVGRLLRRLFRRMPRGVAAETAAGIIGSTGQDGPELAEEVAVVDGIVVTPQI
ncbi:FkbM family methyltransferase [Micromonospora sp. CPCC 206061]|uniref:FkbM family methyltransferase n=1 Tax=Micromonospora sp. CPCC 206061 TaxID=3122410 RepID=UPI002FEEEA0F